MTRTDDGTRVEHMLRAAKQAHQLADGRERRELSGDDPISLAMVRLLEILGEAANGVTPDLRARYLDIP